MSGIKFDGGKPRISLLPIKQLWAVVSVLEFGAKKYAEGNWKSVPGGKTRYIDAAMRHITSWWGGEKNDSETGLPHLAHAICCLFFLMWLDDNKVEHESE